MTVCGHNQTQQQSPSNSVHTTTQGICISSPGREEIQYSRVKSLDTITQAKDKWGSGMVPWKADEV